jgi:hypothetical protein
MGIAPDHDGGALGHAQIALAQFDALALGQIDQLLDRAVDEPRVRWMGDRFLLHGGVHHDPFEILGLDRSASVRHREALLQQRGDLLLTQPLAPAGQRRAVERSNGSSCRNLWRPLFARAPEIFWHPNPPMQPEPANK